MTIAVSLYILIHYRPQRSCDKVMFSQASVILFTGFVVWQTPPLQTDTHKHPGQTPPRQTPSRQTPPFLGRHPLSWGDTPWAGTPRETPPLPSACWNTHPPPAQCTMATAADSTHPTGMHSCYLIII